MQRMKPDINELELILVEYRRGLKQFVGHQCLIKANVKRAQRTGSHMGPPMQLFCAKNAPLIHAFHEKIKKVKKQLYKLNLEKRGLNELPS